MSVRGSERAYQIAFLVLLIVCFAQATYWILEHTTYTRQVRDRFAALYSADAGAAERLLDAGGTAEEVEQLFPHLAVQSSGDVRVRPENLNALYDERRSRVNRFGWEGTFFLVVLIAAMLVILQALRQNTRLLRRQRNLLAAVTHEFKSPLASVKLSAETLQLRRPEAEDATRLADRIVRDVDRLEVLVTNLLETARIEDREVELRPRAVALDGVVDALLDDERQRLGEGGARVDYVGEVPSNVAVQADAEALNTVLANLLSNATKSVTAAGGGSIRVSARPAGADKDQVEVEIRDDGLGFEPREAGRLFEKFYRPGDEMRRRTRGSGLGLFLVRHLVELHGGSVEASSEGPGRGASFRVRWPAPRPFAAFEAGTRR